MFNLFQNAVGFFTNDIDKAETGAKALYHSGKFIIECGIDFLQWLY